MKKTEIIVPIEVLAYDELTPQESQLVAEAREATFRSYAPYSKFKVGAAIQLSNGEIVSGSNQENAAYPSGTCAERTTCYYAHSRYPQARFEAIAIAARTENDEFQATPISPCGACRQALLEYEVIGGAPIKVLLVGAEQVYRLPSVVNLLPLAFTEF